MVETCLIKKAKLIIKHIMVDWHLFLMTTVGVPLLSSAWKQLTNVQEVKTLKVEYHQNDRRINRASDDM